MISFTCGFSRQAVNLDKNFFPQPWTEKQWEETISDPSYLSFGLYDAEELIGFTLFFVDAVDHFAHLLKVLINPSYRGQKLGSHIMKKALGELSSKGFQRVYLEVSTKNIPAISCYKGLNFSVLTIKKKFYSDGHDAYAMQLNL